MGERMEICRRCRGTARLPGLACKTCFGRGKYDPSKTFTPTGKIVPSGYKLCTACSGSGVGHWLKCNQCARSNTPGFLNMGEYMKKCNRCRGLGKIPGIACDTCKGRMMLRE